MIASDLKQYLGLFLAFLSLPAIGSAQVPPAKPDQPANNAFRVFVGVNAPTPSSQVRALLFTAEGDRLCTGGEDKLVQVLPLQRGRIGGGVGKIRWAIERGDYGAIRALAREGNSNIVAVAGKGWSGAMGEIAWFDINTGEQVGFEGLAHDQVVPSLVSSADGRWLVSSDLTGKVAARAGRAGPPITLVPAGQTIHQFMPLAMLGADWAAAPVHTGTTWDIQLFDLSQLPNSAKPVRAMGARLQGWCTALAGHSSGQLLAAADMTGSVYIWNLKAGGPPQVIPLGQTTALTLAFHPTQPVLLFGGQSPVAGGAVGGTLGVIDLTNGPATRPAVAHGTAAPVLTACFSPQGDRIAFATLRENNVALVDYPLRPAPEGLKPATISQGTSVTAAAVMKIPFDATSAPVPALVVQTTGKPLRALFLDRAELVSLNTGTIPASPLSRFQPAGHGGGQCECDGGKAAIRWDPRIHGRVVASAAFTVGNRKLFATAMEYSHQIWLYELVPGNPQAQLIRQFWGHSSLINHLSGWNVDDRAYLVSTANDGTARVWSLDSAFSTDVNLKRWGAVFEIAGGKVKTKALDYSGPLFARLMAPGDMVESLAWTDPATGKERTAKSASEIIATLAAAPPGTQMGFQSSRGGALQPFFQNVDAFQHHLALFLRDDEWVVWHPSGFYSCHPNGENLIGWQLNGPTKGKPVTFFKGEQFAPEFHQADLIRDLLFFSRPLQAFQAHGARQQQFAEVLPNVAPAEVGFAPQIAGSLPPDVQLVVPAEIKVSDLESGAAKLTVRVASRSNEPVKSVQISLNGRAGPEIAVDKQTAELTIPIQRAPSGDFKISAVASTISTVGLSKAEVRRVIENPKIPKPKRGRTLHVLAVGISNYQVGDLKLRFADSDALRMFETLKASFPRNVDGTQRDFFDQIDAHMLRNAEATREAVLKAIDALAQRMRPDDAAVVFLAGHGFDDKPRPAANQLAGARAGGGMPLTNECYLFAPVDAQKGKEFDTCISDEEIGQRFWKADGTLLLVLDTCRSGSFQPGRAVPVDENLRLGRAKFGIQVFAATQKGQDAHEDESSQSGIFTNILLTGMSGAADVKGDGVVTTADLDFYLKDAVTEVSRKLQKTQKFVSTRPDEFNDFPLTRPAKKVAEK